MTTTAAPQTTGVSNTNTSSPPANGGGAATGPLHAALDHAGDAAASAARTIGEGLAAARDSLGRCADDARVLGAEYVENARDSVRVRPLTALVGALAVGVLIGRLCR
jgi:ElaB/YqjD/DUF883 family membrane-anchored ribosome-binding protein